MANTTTDCIVCGESLAAGSHGHEASVGERIFCLVCANDRVWTATACRFEDCKILTCPYGHMHKVARV